MYAVIAHVRETKEKPAETPVEKQPFNSLTSFKIISKKSSFIMIHNFATISSTHYTPLPQRLAPIYVL